MDVVNELITVGYVHDVYGVVLDDDFHIDAEATMRQRKRLQADGSYKSAYLAHFLDAVAIDADTGGSS